MSNMKAEALLLCLIILAVEGELLRKPRESNEIRKLGKAKKTPFLYLDRFGKWLNAMDMTNASVFSADHFIFSQPETANVSAMTTSFYSDTSVFCVPEQIPAVNSNCWNWNVEGVEYFGEQQKGCDNELCSKAVCDCDPYCCDTSWDLSCRGFQMNSLTEVDNYFNVGCAASKLCCEPEGAYPKPPLPTNPTPIRIIDMTNFTNATCDVEEWSPPNDSNCWKWNDMEKGSALQKGCDYQSCQDVVCFCDPYCCQVSWDLSCRGFEMTDSGFYDNPFTPGCSASILCCESEESAPKPPVKYSAMLTKR